MRMKAIHLHNDIVSHFKEKGERVKLNKFEYEYIFLFFIFIFSNSLATHFVIYVSILFIDFINMSPSSA